MPKARTSTPLLAGPVGHYAFALAMVAIAFLFRMLLEPITRTGAPFVLFIGAVLFSSIVGGVRAGILASIVSAPLGAYELVVRIRYSVTIASVQAVLFLLDCAIVLYLTELIMRARRSVEHAEERLRLATSAGGILCWDLDIARGQLQWSPHAPVGDGQVSSVEAWMGLVEAEDREAFQRGYLHSLEPGSDGRFACEARARGSDGMVRFFAWSGQTYFEDRPTGRLAVRQLGSVVDVSERRRREDERQVFVSLLENSSDFIGIADPEGKPIWVNPAGRRMVGLPDDIRVEETQIADYYPAEERAFATDVILKSMLERGRWSGETFFRNWRTGEPIAVSDEHFVIRDSGGGRVLGMATITRDISEARRIRDELRESEERFRLTIDEAPIGMALVALDGRFIRVNRSLCEIVGYTREELERLHFQEITHAEDVDADVALASQVARGEMPRYQLEKRYIRKDGAPVTIMLSVSILRDSDGAPLYYIAQVEDISERKRAERELRFSEAQFSGIVTISADAIVSVDEEQRITLFNRGAENIFGYSKNEIIGKPLDILIPERLRQTHRRDVSRFAGGPVTARRMGERSAVILGRRKNGEEFPADAAISRLEVDGRKILTVALRDVSDQKRVEMEQRLLAETGATLFASLDYEKTLAAVGKLMVLSFADWCIVDVIDREGQTRRLKVACSDPTKAAYCVDWERLQLDRTRRYLVRSVMETRRPMLIEKMADGQIDSFAQSPEHLRLLRAFEAKSVLVVPLLVRDQLVGVLGFISSKPSRTYRARDLPFAEALAERAALAIENGELYRKAVHATRLREEVLGVVAHDLRNPVSAILLQTDLMVRSGGQPERRSQKPVGRIQRAASRLNRLIQDLLDVSTIEAGSLGLEREPIAPRPLIEDFAEIQRPLVESERLTLLLELEAELPEVWADRDRLLQVLENLVGNAMKFTPPGGRITVGAEDRGDAVQFWVADTGCGIAAEGLAHVFDRFWQARRQPRQGAGLGLAISRGIVEAHGGRIWVESTLGRGSTFFFTIPKSPRIEAADAARP